MARSLRVLPWIALALPALACAQSARQVAPERLPGYWILINQNSVDVDVPNSGVNLDKPGCASVSFVIGSDGKPQDLAVRKVVPAGDLGKVALNAVSKFRYGPSLANKAEAPIATYYVVPFNVSSDALSQQRVMAPCRLAGYGD